MYGEAGGREWDPYAAKYGGCPNPPCEDDYDDDEYNDTESPASTFANTLSGMESKGKEVINDLPRQGKLLGDKAKNDTKAIAKGFVKKGAQVADAVSDGSTVVAVIAVAAAPVTGGSSLGVAGAALSVGTAADVSSTVLKGADAAFNNGSKEDFKNQMTKTVINFASGKLLNRVAGTAVKTNSIGQYYKPSNGQYATKVFGNIITAARDATKVAIGLGL